MLDALELTFHCKFYVLQITEPSVSVVSPDKVNYSYPESTVDHESDRLKSATPRHSVRFAEPADLTVTVNEAAVSSTQVDSANSVTGVETRQPAGAWSVTTTMTPDNKASIVAV